MEKGQICEIGLFDTHRTANLPRLPILKKKSSLFSKKPNFFTFWRNVSFAFYDKFATNW